MVKGVALVILSSLGVGFFRILLFFEGSLSLAWFFLELSSICLVPLFFCVGVSVNLVGLLYYLIVSGISSCLILFSILFSACPLFFVLGFLVKFGIFPFVGWVYCVLKDSNWFVV